MNFAGTYTCLMNTPNGKRETRIVIRRNARAYEGELISSSGGCELLENIHTQGSSIIFEVQCGSSRQKISMNRTSMDGSIIIEQSSGNSKTAELENLTYTEPHRRALILYATMTKNTEKIALAMKESFEYYHWECRCYRMKNSTNWAEIQENLYFDDYDVVCLGSPIVAGYPLTIVDKLFSLGAGGELENHVQKMVDEGREFSMTPETMGGSPGPEGPGGPGGDPGADGGPIFRRRGCAYPGGPVRDNYQPLGIVFTTYGGGFYGSGECQTTLSALKLFLELQNVTVVGTFACCGEEYGPAGVKEGKKPNVTGPGGIADPIYYDTKDGKVQGSYFFHNQMWNHPNERDINKAKYLVADLVEDYFMTYDGQRGFVRSEYISLS